MITPERLTELRNRMDDIIVNPNLSHQECARIILDLLDEIERLKKYDLSSIGVHDVEKYYHECTWVVVDEPDGVNAKCSYPECERRARILTDFLTFKMEKIDTKTCPICKTEYQVELDKCPWPRCNP